MNEIFAAIAANGVSTVVVGVILYLIIHFQINSFEQKEKQEQSDRESAREKRLQNRDIAMLEEMKSIFAAFQKLPEHTVEEEDKNRHINEFITHQLDCLVEEGADRAVYFSLHNGGRDLAGRGFLKMSIMEESVDADCSSIMSKYQNLPRALFTTLYKNLNEKDFYDVEDVEKIKQTDPMTYQFLAEHGAKVAMFRPVKRSDGLMIGIVGMEYVNNSCDNLKKAKQNIDKKTNRIVGALLG